MDTKYPLKSVPRACVIGAGPAGLYSAKFLANKGVNVTVYEKSKDVLGNYKYSNPQTYNSVGKILYDPRIRFNLKTEIKDGIVDDDKYDFYVCATGGVPRKLEIKGGEYAIPAMDLVKSYFKNKNLENNEINPYNRINYSKKEHDSLESYNKLGNKICIVGMGNVTMDLIEYIIKSAKTIKELTVISRSSLKDAAFDNHKLRNILNSRKWDIGIINAENSLKATNEDRKTTRRYEMLSDFHVIPLLKSILLPKQIFRNVKNFLQNFILNRKTPKLNLVFNTSIQEIIKENGKFKIKEPLNKNKGGCLIDSVFDSVISSIGFIPMRPKIVTKKPIFYIGWCSKISRGNIEEAKKDAEQVVEEIANTLFKKMEPSQN